jgi:hypothetical protein
LPVAQYLRQHSPRQGSHCFGSELGFGIRLFYKTQCLGTTGRIRPKSPGLRQ